MIQRKLKIVALASAVLVVGCVKSNYPLTAQERQFYMPVDRARIAKARDQKIPKIMAETHLAAAKLLEQQHDIPKAIAQYRKAIKSDKKLTEAYHRLGVLLSMIGHNKDATKMLRRAVVLSPKQPVLHNDLGFSLTLQAQWAEAEREFRKSIDIEPRFVRAYINLGLTLSKLDRFDEAKATFLAVLPEQDAYYNLGLMYRSLRRFAEASDAFQYVLEIEPEFGAATSQLEDLRDLVPTQSKSALPTPKENLAFLPTKMEKTQLAQADTLRPEGQPSAFKEFFEDEEVAAAAPVEIHKPKIAAKSDSNIEVAKPATPTLAFAPDTNLKNQPLSDIAQVVRANSADPGLIEQWTLGERHGAPKAEALKPLPLRHESEELVSYLSEKEIVPTLAELAMSPIGEIVDVINHFNIADDWSAWTHLAAYATTISHSHEASVSPLATLMVMGYDLREVRDEINCLEDELEAQLTEKMVSEAKAVEALLADATPDESFDWLMNHSPMVSPKSLAELEMFMPTPPLDQDYVSLIAKQVDPSVDIERIWSGQSEVNYIPSVSVSAKPRDVEVARPVLASSVFERPIMESFLPESDEPKHWSLLPMPSSQEVAGFDNRFPEFAHNSSDGPFAWVERFAVFDDGISVLLNETRCWDEQRRLEELEPELMGYCRSDFVYACEPGFTDVPPFLDMNEVTKTTPRSLPWLGSPDERGR